VQETKTPQIEVLFHKGNTNPLIRIGYTVRMKGTFQTTCMQLITYEA